MSDIMTIRECLRRADQEGLHIAESCLRRWVASGQIPHCKSGTRTYIFYPNLVDYMKNGKE